MSSHAYERPHGSRGVRRRAGARRPPPPRLEPLEDRILPSLTPLLLKDINPGSASSDPFPFTVVGSAVFFSANDGAHGVELWKSDGTTGGTALVADIFPGPGFSDPSYLTNVNGTLFFMAEDSIAHGNQLWRSNGAAAGTVMLTDVQPAFTHTARTAFANVNGTLFFEASDGTNGQQVWRSNGASAGTVLLRSIDPGADPFFPPRQLVNVNGTVFFPADDGANGSQLWKSNGTASGTQMVADINPHENPFPNGSFPKYLTNSKGTLFFQANDGTHGRQLWRSQGTAASTTMVSNLYPGGTNGGGPYGITNVNGTLFFAAVNSATEYDLWRSDGTASGTQIVTKLNFNIYFENPVNLNGTLFFQDSDGIHGAQLWSSDGTAAGTSMVKVIRPGGNAYADYLTNVDGTLFFSSNDGTHGFELWESNGTAAGTQMVADIMPGQSGSIPTGLTNFNGQLLFSANDGVHGFEPWILDLRAPSSTTANSSPDPSVFLQTVTLTATVRASPPGSGTPTGIVTFQEGSKVVGIRPLQVVHGVDEATFSTRGLAPGKHTITAIYSGDGNFSPSQSPAFVQTVNKDQTGTKVTSSANPSIVQHTVTFTAVVSASAPGAGTPTGMVTFKDGSIVLGAGRLQVVAGMDQATFSTAKLSVGTHTITATYAGDNAYAGSASPALVQTVTSHGAASASAALITLGILGGMPDVWSVPGRVQAASSVPVHVESVDHLDQFFATASLPSERSLRALSRPRPSAVVPHRMPEVRDLFDS
jgi:ELWxxDGT repeat protein